MVKLKPEATATPGESEGTTKLKRNTKGKPNGKRRAKVLKWEGGKIKKYTSNRQQVTEGVEDLKQRQWRKEKARHEKRK